MGKQWKCIHFPVSDLRWLIMASTTWLTTLEEKWAHSLLARLYHEYVVLTGYRARSMEGLLAFSFIMRAAAKAIFLDDDFWLLIHDWTIHFFFFWVVWKRERESRVGKWSLIVLPKNGPWKIYLRQLAEQLGGLSIWPHWGKIQFLVQIFQKILDEFFGGQIPIFAPKITE